jgi:hypothetical protein
MPSKQKPSRSSPPWKGTLGTVREITLRAKRQIGSKGALERC